MKTVLLVAIALCVNLSAIAQNKLPDFNEFQPINKELEFEQREYTLVMVSDARCGYSRIGIDSLANWEKPLNLNICIVDFAPEKMIGKYFAKYFDNFHFFKPNNTDVFPDKKFPVFILYRNNKKIWKLGYLPNNLTAKISKRIKAPKSNY